MFSQSKDGISVIKTVLGVALFSHLGHIPEDHLPRETNTTNTDINWIQTNNLAIYTDLLYLLSHQNA